ncbi:MAG TPA: glutathione binding-like protein, partial [Candidatus Caenarcaniphilales bacterium]
YGILDRRLVDCDYLMGSNYTILDILTYGWLYLHTLVPGKIDEFSNLKRWVVQMGDRPAV